MTCEKPNCMIYYLPSMSVKKDLVHTCSTNCIFNEIGIPFLASEVFFGFDYKNENSVKIFFVHFQNELIIQALKINLLKFGTFDYILIEF